MTHDIFISYSSKDKTIADTVCAKLEERKIRCWIAPRDIPAGHNFARSIISAINECKVFVLVWSASTNTSEHILNEINQAFDQGIPIIPFRIQDVQPTLEMRYYFGRTHWLDALTPPLENHIGILAETIQAFLDKKQEMTPEPVAVEPVRAGEKVKREEITPPVTPGEVTEPVPISKEEIAQSPKPEVKTESAPRAAKKSVIAEVHPIGVPPLNKKVLISVLSGVMVVAALVTIYLLGVFKGPSGAVKTEAPIISIGVTASVTPTINSPTITPTVTPKVSSTPTPLANWVEDFAEIILTAIIDRQPDFQDDFVAVQPEWSFSLGDKDKCPSNTIDIEDQRLRMNADLGECWVWANLLQPDLQNFVVQIEMNLQSNSSGDIVIMNATNTRDFGFSLRNDGRWDCNACSGNYCESIDSGKTSIESGSPATILVILDQMKYVVYVNAAPVLFYPIPRYENRSKASHLSLTVQNGSDFRSNMAEFDNLKIWDLDEIVILSTLVP